MNELDNEILKEFEEAGEVITPEDMHKNKIIKKHHEIYKADKSGDVAKKTADALGITKEEVLDVMTEEAKRFKKLISDGWKEFEEMVADSGRPMPARFKKKRTRGISKKSQILQDAIYDFVSSMEARVSIRQIFYAMTVQGLIEKTEGGYHKICYQTKNMREGGRLPYNWIADSTRWTIKPTTYNSLQDAANYWEKAYRRALWLDQDVYVEIWIEKDALAGVISDITDRYDVPLMVVRGYSSLTFLYESAMQIKEINKPSYIYHFGDHDPSGRNAAENVEKKLIEFGADINFEIAAVTMDQIDEWNLPTRPTKKSDPRSKKFDGPSVELDAIPVDIFRNLIEEKITQHIDQDILRRQEKIEQEEREVISNIFGNL